MWEHQNDVGESRAEVEGPVKARGFRVLRIVKNIPERGSLKSLSSEPFQTCIMGIT